MRATSSGTITFGLVTIPVKFYTACSSERVQLRQLNSKTYSPLKQQMFDPTTGDVVPSDEIAKGYEISKGKFVIFSKEELKSLEHDRTNSIDVLEFVPEDTVDLVGVEKTYYLGPNKGGDKPYRLISKVLDSKGVVAVGRWAVRGKNNLVIIRPYNDGLIVHQMYYGNEVRDFSEIIDNVPEIVIRDGEMQLAEQLIDQMTSEAFDCSEYRDEYAARVLDAANKKQAGETIEVGPAKTASDSMDMFEALKASLKATKQPAKKKTSKKTSKKATKKKAS